MLRSILLFCSVLLLTGSVFAQRNCGSMDHLQELQQKYPGYQQEMDRIERFTEQYIRNADEKALSNGVLTIPVIVHVVYNGSAQNISDAQIQSQMDVLNEDFRRTNADAGNTPSDFSGVAADSEIEFCLIQTIRVPTTRTSFGTNNSVKSSGSGGSDVVTPASAMNVWVCNIGGGILGYAQFPGGPASTDGVVCDYRYFGTVGTATAPFDLGRTMTHEVGHYLNLRHIWGDGGCNVDDFVSDTPTAGGPNYTGSPCTYPGPNSCKPRGRNGGNDLPDMFQNYMDYSDDGCMNLFTTGQKDRMWAAVNASRPGLISAQCDGTPPPPVEICNNGTDDDGDGDIDCADSDCTTASNCVDPGSCDAPTGLTHTRRKGGREATLSWNAVSGAADYFVEVFSNGTLFASGTVTGTSASLSGLTKNAPYTWQVTTNCSSGATSDPATASFNARLLQGAGNFQEVSLFPNPSNQDRVQLNWDLDNGVSAAPGITETSTIASDVTLHLRDLNGRVIQRQFFEAGISQATIDLAGLSRGVYLVQLTDASGYSVTTKLIKL